MVVDQIRPSKTSANAQQTAAPGRGFPEVAKKIGMPKRVVIGFTLALVSLIIILPLGFAFSPIIGSFTLYNNKRNKIGMKDYCSRLIKPLAFRLNNAKTEVMKGKVAKPFNEILSKKQDSTLIGSLTLGTQIDRYDPAYSSLREKGDNLYIVAIQDDWEVKQRGLSFPLNETHNCGTIYTRHDVEDHRPVPFETLEKLADEINTQRMDGKDVYVNCQAGVGRSTQVIIAYLIKYEGMTPDEAIEHVQNRRPQVSPLTSSQITAKFDKLKGNELLTLTKEGIEDLYPKYPVSSGCFNTPNILRSKDKKAKKAWKQVERYQNFSRVEFKRQISKQLGPSPSDLLNAKLSDLAALTTDKSEALIIAHELMQSDNHDHKTRALYIATSINVELESDNAILKTKIVTEHKEFLYRRGNDLQQTSPKNKISDVTLLNAAFDPNVTLINLQNMLTQADPTEALFIAHELMQSNNPEHKTRALYIATSIQVEPKSENETLKTKIVTEHGEVLDPSRKNLQQTSPKNKISAITLLNAAFDPNVTLINLQYMVTLADPTKALIIARKLKESKNSQDHERASAIATPNVIEKVPIVAKAALVIQSAVRDHQAIAKPAVVIQSAVRGRQARAAIAKAAVTELNKEHYRQTIRNYDSSIVKRIKKEGDLSSTTIDEAVALAKSGFEPTLKEEHNELIAFYIKYQHYHLL